MMKILIQLFLAFLKIGAFSFGGGYAALPLIQSEVIDHFHWIDKADFTDLITISQMTPGPIAINAATFIGHQLAGIPGSIAATIGVIVPSCIIVTIIAYFYTKYRKLSTMQKILVSLRPAVVAMIFAAGLQILLPAIFKSGKFSLSGSNFDFTAFALFVLAMVLLRQKQFKKIGPITVMILCGVIELIVEIL